MTSEGVVDHADGLHAPHHPLKGFVRERGHVHLTRPEARWGKAIVNVVPAERTKTTRMLPHAKETRKTESMTTGHGAPDDAVHFLQTYRTLAGLHLLFHISP